MRYRMAYQGLLLLLAAGPLVGRAWAELRFAQPAVDLGKVRSGVPTAHEFTFVCVESHDAEITDVKTSCGCLAPQLTKRAYRAGEKGSLRVELNTLTQPPGPHLWRVQVFYRSEGVTYEMPLKLKAEVVREVSVEPAALVVSGDRAVRREIVVTDVRPRPLTITSVQGTPDLRARVEPPTRDASGRWTCKIVLDVAPPERDGRRDAVLAIYTDDPDY